MSGGQDQTLPILPHKSNVYHADAGGVMGHAYRGISHDFQGMDITYVLSGPERRW